MSGHPIPIGVAKRSYLTPAMRAEAGRLGFEFGPGQPHVFSAGVFGPDPEMPLINTRCGSCAYPFIFGLDPSELCQFQEEGLLFPRPGHYRMHIGRCPHCSVLVVAWVQEE